MVAATSCSTMATPTGRPAWAWRSWTDEQSRLALDPKTPRPAPSRGTAGTTATGESLKRVPFNRPVLMGNELAYIQQAVAEMHLAGDGPFSHRCQQFLE